MILTVTANPAYDVTYEVAAVRPGEVHRVTTAHLRPGGKGINVAAVLRQLGEEVLASGFGTMAFEEELRAAGLRAELVTSLPHVRRTVAVVEPGRTTSFWEPGTQLPADSARLLLDRVSELLTSAACLVVSGSLPPGAPDSLAADLARLALDVGVPAVVDTSGAALRAAAVVPGVVLMPNLDELEELTGPCRTDADVVAASDRLVAAGARAVVATRGRDGMVATDATGTWTTRPPEVAGNPTGAGDAAAAAVARGLARGLPLPHIAADATALSAAAVTAPVAGQVDLERYRELTDAVEPRRWHARDTEEANR